VIPTWPKGSINLFEHMLKLLLMINSRTMLKCDLTPEWLDKLARYEEELMFGINVSVARHEFFARPTYASLRQEVFDFLDALVQKRLNGHREEDNLQAILDANADRTLNAQDLRYDAYLLLIAGIENVSRLIFKVIERLCVNPEWKAEVVAELAAFQPDSFLRGLSAFPKLRATIMEVERLHPISVILLQYSAKPFSYGGYDFPAEQRFLHGHTLVHFLDEIYDHPFDFRPTRWLENEYSKRTHATYGQGAHTCLGINVSRIYTPIVLAELFQHRDVQLHYAPYFKNQLSDGTCQARPDWMAEVFLRST
jgi:cytochrome P450